MRGLEVFAFLFFCTVVSGQNQSKQGDPEYNYEYRKDSFYHVFISGLEADSVLSHTRAIQFFDFLINNRDDCSVTYFGYELGFALKDWGSLELAKKQYEKLLKYAEEGELTEGISHAYKGLGDVAQSAADFEQSINYYLLAENGWIKTRNHQKLGFLYNNIGVSYRKQGNTYMALNYYIKAIEQLQRANDLLALAYINANVGNIYLDQEDYKQALTYYNIGLEAGNEADNQRMIANLANSVGLAYDKLGETVKSFHYFKKAYSNALNSDNKEIILLSLSNLGESYADLEKYDSAIYYIKESLKKSKDLDDAESQTIALLGLGTVYLKQKEFRKAKTYLEEGLKLASNTNQARREATAYEDLSIALEFLGEYDKALLYARKFKHVSDSLSEIKQSNNLKLLQAEFEFESEQEKSNTQIKQLTAENEIQDLRLRERNLFIIISLVTFLAFGIIGYLVYNQRLVKEKKEANDLKQKLLRLQLNPHFTYNSLNAIQSMIYEEEHRQKAADYLAQFSGLMR
ncbi:MAG: tetratricopeptide repeat protein, partial [Bacteroidota bacterium]